MTMYLEKDVKKLRAEMDFLKTVVKSRKTIIFKSDDSVVANAGKFEVFATCQSHALFELSFSMSEVSGVMKIKVNDVQLYSFAPYVGENAIDLDCELLTGVNVVEIIYEDYFYVDNLSLKISGFISAKDYGTKMTSMTFMTGIIAAMYNGAKKKYVLYRNGGSGFSELMSFSDAVCCASRLSDGYFVVVRGNGTSMSASKYTSYGGLISTVGFTADASAFFAGEGSGGALFFAAERGKIKKYFFNSSLDLTVTETTLYGKETVDGGANGLCLIGFDDKVKYVLETQGETVVKNLGNISRPHIFTSGLKTYVGYNKDGLIYKLDLESGARSKLSYGEEYLPVGNGFYLLRTGQSFDYIEEIR